MILSPYYLDEPIILYIGGLNQHLTKIYLQILPIYFLRMSINYGVTVQDITDKQSKVNITNFTNKLACKNNPTIDISACTVKLLHNI